MLTDAHCHPTDDVKSLAHIAEVPLRMATMATRFNDLELVARIATEYPEKVVPAFGLHPWYSHLVAVILPETKFAHYQAVLEPEPTEEEIELLPEPILLAIHVNKIKQLLVEFPHAMLGEVGLDKAFHVRIGSDISKFRVKIDHQRTVLGSQLAVAAELYRAVSMHGVQASQPLFDEVKIYTISDHKLRAVCLHSYGGSADFYKQIWRQLSIPVYVSIAVLINGRIPEKKMKILLQALDPKLVLSESDYHSAGAYQVELVEKSVALFAEHFNWNWETTEETIYSNFVEFAGIK